MEYDIWVAPGKSLPDQIEDDVNYYVKNWGVDPSKIHIGLMPGKDDQGHNLSVADAQKVAQYVMSAGLGGVMTWDLDRDYKGSSDKKSDYFNAISTVLKLPTSAQEAPVAGVPHYGKRLPKLFVQTEKMPVLIDPDKNLPTKLRNPFGLK